MYTRDKMRGKPWSPMSEPVTADKRNVSSLTNQGIRVKNARTGKCMSNETINLIFILEVFVYKVVFYKCGPTPISILGDVSAKKLSAKCDQILAIRSQFDSDHRVHFLRLHHANPLPLCDRFCVCPLFLRQKIINNSTDAMKAYRSA